MSLSEVHLDGKAYVWTGTRWLGKRDRLTPPLSATSRLNKLIKGKLEHEDAAVTSPEELLEMAQAAREVGQLDRAIRLLQRAAAARPEHSGTVAVFSSTLRQDGRPGEALDIIEQLLPSGYPPLLTSRAAALCDLKRWEEAQRQINQVIAICGGRADAEALNVLSRIRAHCG